MIADVLNVYGQEVAPDRKTARNIAYKIGKLLEWWGDKTVAEITTKTCKAYSAERGNSGAGADLKTLRAAVGYWNTSDYGPLTVMPAFWKPQEPAARERYLTKKEAAKLLWAARRDQHIKRLILLGLYTGSRPGVILALEWSQIDLDAGVLIRTKPGAILSHNKKAPSVRLGRRIMSHLRRWKRIDGDSQYVCHYMGRATDDPHATWRRVVKASKLKGKITRHTLRHTRATWMAQAGVSLFEAAGFLGMTIKTLERTYAHHDPEHQEHAANI